MKHEHSQDQFAVFVAAIVKDVSEATFVRPCHGSFKVSVRRCNRVDACKHSRSVGSAIENEDRRLAIPPGRVAQELVDCFAKRLRSLPKLALGNEDVAVALP